VLSCCQRAYFTEIKRRHLSGYQVHTPCFARPRRASPCYHRCDRLISACLFSTDKTTRDNQFVRLFASFCTPHDSIHRSASTHSLSTFAVSSSTTTTNRWGCFLIRSDNTHGIVSLLLGRSVIYTDKHGALSVSRLLISLERCS
jgi:hypothetical protein